MLRPGDDGYEEERFQFNETLYTYDKLGLIAIANSLLDKWHGVDTPEETYQEAPDKELQYIASGDDDKGEDNYDNE